MNSFDQQAINPVSGTPGRGSFRRCGRLAQRSPTPPIGTISDLASDSPGRWRGSEKTVVRGGFGVAYAHPFDHGVPNANSLGFEKSAGLSYAR